MVKDFPMLNVQWREGKQFPPSGSNHDAPKKNRFYALQSQSDQQGSPDIVTGVMRFGKKGKHSPWYVGPYQILKRVGKVAYELHLPSELALVHPVFHVSMLKRCIGDPVSILPLEALGVDENLSYEEVPDEILDR
ncbi:uncharacterized protein [Solanum tuberosum]|uniref:uncharacterized protein n=1 Tax=Solanum tuberosum TaxID=4113 RepID=UPI00073A51AF|nr:PREDICTED: uncharacterized protein LOC107063299 [Solanum tuberosum]